VERERAELNHISAVGAARLAEADLKRLTGLPPQTRIEPTVTLAEPPGAPEELEALVAAALEQRAELRALALRVAAARSGVRVAAAAGRPQAALSAGFDYANPNRLILPPSAEWRHTWHAGVQASWRVFDGGRTSAAAARVRAQADALQARLDEAQRAVRLEITRQLVEVRTARAALNVAQRGREAARENQRVTQDRYREGVSRSAELLDAQTTLLRAGLDETAAAARLHVARAALDRAVGR